MIGLIIGLVVVILVAGGIVAFLTLRSKSHALTFQGKKIANPDEVLAAAESNLKSVVTSRHGVEGGDTRCYFAQPATRGPGEKKTDVDSSLVCGPVLFVDGNTADEYLSFPLSSAPAKGGSVDLTAANSPSSNTPMALTSQMILKRPDGLKPPAGSGGLAVPAPPPTAANSLVSASLGSQSVPSAPAGAMIGSFNGGLKLIAFGTVPRYGLGDSARSAAPGQKLIAFRVASAEGNNGTVASLLSATTLSVNNAAGERLPPATDEYYVASVPQSATSVNLVVADGGATQTLSLLNGKPGANNIAVLARTNRNDDVNSTQNMVFNYSTTVVAQDGTSMTNETLPATVKTATLAYWAGPTNATPNNPAAAFLVVDCSFSDPHNPGTFSFPSAVLSFTPTGGQAIPDTPLPNHGLDAFVVPATTTGGTLTISGSFTQQFSNDASSYTTTVATPVTFPISFTG